MREKVVGILGGMGPEATVDFFSKVVALTPARKDQEHLRIIIDNNPKIPDRTQAILNHDRSIVPMLIETANNLKNAGADFIAIPCNTAHYFYEDLAREVSIPILHMIREVGTQVRATFPGCKKVALIATTGTTSIGLYQAEFQRFGVEIMTPDLLSQDRVMKAILGIKSAGGKKMARRTLLRAANEIIERGAEALIIGCTEVPLVIGAPDFSVPVFESTYILAEATVKLALS